MNNVGAKFIGYQEMFGDPAEPIFNITGDHQLRGSTVFTATLKRLHIDVPEVPTFEEWKQEQCVHERGMLAFRRMCHKCGVVMGDEAVRS